MQSTRVCFLFCVFSVCLQADLPGQNLIKKGATLTMLSDGYSFTEGPAVDDAGDVYFTDQPNDQILQWTPGQGVKVFMSPAGRSNGMYFDGDGRLISCADEKNEMWAITKDGQVEVLLDEFEGKQLNGPNDLWIHPNGDIYFTDPFYKRKWWDHDERPQASENAYLLRAGAKKASMVAKDFVRPNGIVGTKDGKTLYIADIGDKKTYRFSIDDAGLLQDRTLFCEMGSDGMTLDRKGNLYLTGDGVTVFSPKGEQIAHIPVPERWTANVVFGGKKRKTLFVTAMKKVYTLEMRVKGMY
ncbi:MAG: SMP-30/gluconolactonase/LRE family protein [Saprospiraceae bacterium]|nr:SMP-30/gluconolactonase/LRE family protein [Saprospiraceae bacterium]